MVPEEPTTLYLLVPVNWEYDDSIYERQGLLNPEKAYRSYERAALERRKLQYRDLEYAVRGRLTLYTQGMEGIYAVSSEMPHRASRRLRALGIEWDEDEGLWGLSQKLEAFLSQYEYDQVPDEIMGELSSLLNRISFYEVLAVPLDPAPEDEGGA